MSAHITVGVDGSDGGRRALGWSLRYAAEIGAEVHAVTVFHYAHSADPHHVPSHRAAQRRRDAEQISEREIGAMLAAHPGTGPVNRVVVPAETTAAALRRAAEGSDLLVVGSHGHGVVETRLLGSVSADCLRHAPCPVVVVPTQWSDTYGSPAACRSEGPEGRRRAPAG
jgi:nucleotide-binding universal stress UspA family protein